jgi:hypothetical protein
MRILLTLLLSLIVSLGIGQQVNAPDPKEFTINTSAQSANGFSLSGFNSTDILLCAIGLPVAPTGTTFYITTTSGLTAATGYTLTGNKTRLAFTGTQTNINNALESLRINTSGTAGNIQISVSGTVNPTGFFYNPTNGHFYRPISTGTNFANAITASRNTTFKGQQGYLVTITSADEDAFIFNNVPQSNIWFAADDRATEGRWVISDGPEMGTVLKTSNGQFTGNIQGVYNNWASGEPNDWGGDEDAAVTKWGGGNQWNDLAVTNSNSYVIEYGTWTNPDDQTFTDFYNNSVVHTNGPNTNLIANFNFNFGNNIDKTKFLGAIFKRNDPLSNWIGNTFKSLNGLGRINLSEQLDTVRVFNTQQYKAKTFGGQVEWCVIYEYDASNQRYRIGIDKREFTGTNVSPNSVTKLKLFDLWDGTIIFKSDDGVWAEYWINTPTQFNFGGSSFVSFIRAGNGFYGISAEFTFTQLGEYKEHKFQFQNYDSSQLKTIYNNIVSVSDVYLAFKELADGGGIFGSGGGTHFTHGIQFKNADINDDGIFDESDCFRLLQNLTGVRNLVDNYTLDNTMQIVLDSIYARIGKSNWQQFPSYLGKEYGFNLLDDKINYTYNLAISWKGDVNLSHSAPPPANGITTMSANFGQVILSGNNQSNAIIITEMSRDTLYVEITFNPADNNIVGTQFQLNYDNSLLKYNKTEYIVNGSPTNYSTNNGTFINLGSLNTDGSQITSAIYKVLFTTTQKLNGGLGLISIGSSEAVNKDGKPLNVKIQ